MKSDCVMPTFELASARVMIEQRIMSAKWRHGFSVPQTLKNTLDKGCT